MVYFKLDAFDRSHVIVQHLFISAVSLFPSCNVGALEDIIHFFLLLIFWGKTIKFLTDYRKSLLFVARIIINLSIT